MSADGERARARRMHGPLELLHVIAYFAPEPAARYEALGLPRGRAGYFASRAAPMGPVPPDVVVATFYVFAPALVTRGMAGGWDPVTPARALQARHDGVDAALRRVLDGALDGGVDGPVVAEAAALAREACAGLRPHGRPLYAGHASLPWPEAPHMQLWHAASLLREHRGDGHVAALLHAGLDPVEALITAAAAGGPLEFLRTTRGWTPEEWAAGEERLRGRGLLGEDLALTPAGRELREDVERRTDDASAAVWERFGDERAERLRELAKAIGGVLRASDLFPAWLTARRPR